MFLVSPLQGKCGILSKPFSTTISGPVIVSPRPTSNYSKGGSSAADYLHRIKVITDSLAAINYPVPDHDLLLYTLNGLGPEYASFVTTMEKRVEPLTFNELRGRLLNHEDRLQRMQNTAPASDQNTNTALFTNRSQPRNQRQRGRDRNSDAYRDSFDGNRPRLSDQNRGRNQPRFDAPQSSSTEDFSEPVRCIICHKAGHSTANCYFRYSQSRNNLAPFLHTFSIRRRC